MSADELSRLSRRVAAGDMQAALAAARLIAARSGSRLPEDLVEPSRKASAMVDAVQCGARLSEWARIRLAPLMYPSDYEFEGLPPEAFLVPKNSFSQHFWITGARILAMAGRDAGGYFEVAFVYEAKEGVHENIQGTSREAFTRALADVVERVIREHAAEQP